MASTTTAESAAADNVSKSRLLDFERVLALVGDRGFRFESGDLKLTVFPASKANSPSGAKCNWRQPVAAAAATKTPKKLPRCEARASQLKVGLLLRGPAGSRLLQGPAGSRLLPAWSFTPAS